jgi:hypothetical protein
MSPEPWGLGVKGGKPAGVGRTFQGQANIFGRASLVPGGSQTAVTLGTNGSHFGKRQALGSSLTAPNTINEIIPRFHFVRRQRLAVVSVWESQRRWCLLSEGAGSVGNLGRG